MTDTNTFCGSGDHRGSEGMLRPQRFFRKLALGDVPVVAAPA